MTIAGVADTHTDLSNASAKGLLHQSLSAYTRPHVLLIDEIGYLSYGPDAANVLFHVVNDRHLRKRPMIFTTNKPLSVWEKVLHDEDLAAAILDRVLERGRFVPLDGPSGRTRHLNLEEVSPSKAERLRISGINGSEFSEPTTPAAYSGTQSSNKIVKANVAWTFRGSHSPLQLSTNHPRFRLVCGYGTVQLLMLCQPGASQPSDLIVVQLDEKSDHRESRMASGNMFGAGHGGFDPKRTVTVTTAKREDGSWDLSPSSQDLRPGEYLITTGMSPQGFDFGIQKQQK